MVPVQCSIVIPNEEIEYLTEFGFGGIGKDGMENVVEYREFNELAVG